LAEENLRECQLSRSIVMAAAETEGDRILAQFMHFDQNADGKIDRGELLTILQGFDADKWTPERVDGIITAADLNKDGAIQYEEFLIWASKEGADQADFLKAADRVPPEAIDSLVRTLSAHSTSSGKDDLVPALEELHKVPWEQKEPAIATLTKILANTVKDPSNPKFRRLRRANPTLQTKIFSVPGCAELLMAAGFEVEGDELVLPEGVDVAWILDELKSFGSQELMEHARAERDARIAAAKAEDAKASELKGRVTGGSAEDRKRLLQQLEYDRQEREMREKLAAEGYREEVGIPAEKKGSAVKRFADIGVDLNKPAGG